VAPKIPNASCVSTQVPGGLSHADATSNLTAAVKQLGLDYVDLMLVHFPATWGGKGGKNRDKSDSYFRKTATEYDSKHGIKWLSCTAK
jgi:diketogulonate reductase-like aldo/keto reductase